MLHCLQIHVLSKMIFRDTNVYGKSLLVPTVTQWIIPKFTLSIKTEESFCVKRIYTPGRRQSNTFLTIDERRLKIVRNRVFECHLSPDWRQMTIENTVSIDF